MALPGCCAGSLRAPAGGLGVVGKPDAELVIKALDMAFEQRGRPQGLLFHSDQGPVCEPFIPPAALALSNASKHESPRKLLGQCADGACVSEPEN